MFYLGLSYFRMMSGFILGNELSLKKYSVYCTVIMLICDNNSLIFASIWWGFVDQHTWYFFFVPLGFIVIAGICFFFIPESPRYYFEKGRF
jgi:hypothetical protein